MSSAQEHYERLLARNYTWMFGVPFRQKVEEQAALVRAAGVVRPGVAVDLGCGSGFQSVALLDMGAEQVHAIDTSPTLLQELASHDGTGGIRMYQADLMGFRALIDGRADTIVCMGDTLTHLGSRDDVSALFGMVADILSPDGRFVLSWRDLSSPPRGLDRFIPLRSTDERIMTCFLEDQGETVLVHDLVQVREPDGWRLEKSAYSKLKLSPAWVRQSLAAVGLTPCYADTVRGMTVLAARP